MPTCCYGFQCYCTYYNPMQLLNGTTCIDHNECEELNAGCDGTCVNTDGDYYCTCPSGLQLGSNNHECEDVDECSQGSACSSGTICVNTWSGYHCINGLFASALTGGELAPATSSALSTNAVVGIFIAALVSLANVGLIAFLAYHWTRRKRATQASAQFVSNHAFRSAETGTVRSFNSLVSKFSGQSDVDSISSCSTTS